MITFGDLGNLGRLGNQLFQISATISYALKNNDSYGFPTWKHEDHFDLKYCFFDNIKVEKTYAEPYFHYCEIPKISYKYNLNLSGYFQSERYFFEHRDLIKELLTPKIEIKRESGLCGIHVRRGDYVNLTDCYVQLGMDYYLEAMRRSGCNKFLIFSDDIWWCKQNFKGNQFEFSENKKDYEDLAIMAKRCEHNIMANSSFSWWGSYLNDNCDKKIIAPARWFGPKLQHNTKDLIPKEWILI